MKNFKKIIGKKHVCMENIITNMIKNYRNCYFKNCGNSIMLVRSLTKVGNPVHSFKGFYHFYFNELNIFSTVWNTHTKKFKYSIIKF